MCWLVVVVWFCQAFCLSHLFRELWCVLWASSLPPPCFHTGWAGAPSLHINVTPHMPGVQLSRRAATPAEWLTPASTQGSPACRRSLDGLATQVMVPPSLLICWSWGVGCGGAPYMGLNRSWALHTGHVLFFTLEHFAPLHHPIHSTTGIHLPPPFTFSLVVLYFLFLSSLLLFVFSFPLLFFFLHLTLHLIHTAHFLINFYTFFHRGLFPWGSLYWAYTSVTPYILTRFGCCLCWLFSPCTPPQIPEMMSSDGLWSSIPHHQYADVSVSFR